jgi:hypothetical protein
LSDTLIIKSFFDQGFCIESSRPHERRVLFIFFEIGDGPGHFQYSGTVPGREPQFVDSHFQKPRGVLVNDAMRPLKNGFAAAQNLFRQEYDNA